MSDGELRLGSVLFLRSFKDYPKKGVTLTYSAPEKEGSHHLAIWLGTWEEGDAGASERLNKMGWYFDPTRVEHASKGGDV